MTIEFSNETIVRQYLLGTLPEGEWDAIEQRLLNEEKFAKNIEVIEDEIVDDYLDGNLTVAERRAMENHFLRPPERQRKLWFARLLRSHLQMAKHPASENIPLVSWFSRPAYSWAMSVAALTLLAAVVSLGIHTANLRQTLETERAKMQSTQAALESSLRQERDQIAKLQDQLGRLEQEKSGTQPGPSGSPVILSLLELNRSDPGVPQLKRSPAKKSVEIRIALVHGVLPSYQATLQTDPEGKNIWSKTDLKPTGNQLIFRIPQSLFSPGEYSVIIAGKGDTHASKYPLRVF